MSEGRDRALAFVVGLMAVVAVANLTLDILSPRTVISQNHYENDAADHATRESAPEGVWWWPSPESWTAFFTCTLFLSTVGLWLVTRETLKHAERTSERELRAYVDIRECVFDDSEIFQTEDDAGGRRLRMTIKVQNFGKTPAHKLTSWAMRQYRIDTSPPAFTAPKGDLSIRDFSPGGQYSHTVLWELPMADYRKLQTGESTMWVWGEIRYTDVFDQPQETDFRFFVGGPAGLEGKGYMAHAKTGNRST